MDSQGPHRFDDELSPFSEAICTVITPDYIDHAVTLRLSLNEFNSKIPLFVLVVGDYDYSYPGIKFIHINAVCCEPGASEAVRRVYGHDIDRLRWCMKSVFLEFLLRKSVVLSVVYCDPDFAFFKSPARLFEYLAQGGVLLTPHWRPPIPSPSIKNFRLNFMDGLFNAGCIGANLLGIAALRWWTLACLHACEKNYEAGLYDDQRYLDLMPIYFPEVVICRDRGVNLADWNLHLRDADERGARVVPDIYPVSLVHFTKNTVRRIESGGDPVLEPFLTRYRDLMERARCAVSVEA